MTMCQWTDNAGDEFMQITIALNSNVLFTIIYNNLTWNRSQQSFLNWSVSYQLLCKLNSTFPHSGNYGDFSFYQKLKLDQRVVDSSSWQTIHINEPSLETNSINVIPSMSLATSVVFAKHESKDDRAQLM